MAETLPQKIEEKEIVSWGFVRQRDESFGYHRYKRYLPEGANFKDSVGHETILYNPDPVRGEIFARFREFWDAERNREERAREKCAEK